MHRSKKQINSPARPLFKIADGLAWERACKSSAV